ARLPGPREPAGAGPAQHVDLELAPGHGPARVALGTGRVLADAAAPGPRVPDLLRPRDPGGGRARALVRRRAPRRARPRRAPPRALVGGVPGHLAAAADAGRRAAAPARPRDDPVVGPMDCLRDRPGGGLLGPPPPGPDDPAGGRRARPGRHRVGG